MFNRVFVENEGHTGFYASLAKEVISVQDIKTIPKDISENDLIVLSGGSDIDKSLYGEESVGILGKRDKLCVDLWHLSQKKRIPLLGICRGHQHIAAMKGIKLIQHLDGEHGRRREVEFEGKFWGSVPKCHHQAVPITKQLNILAATHRADGLSFIEAFSTNQGKVIGVQGHPEWCEEHEAFPSWVRSKLFENLIQEIKQ